MKTLAIRLDDDLHARLTIVAKLAEISITDAIRQAVETQVQTMSSDPTLQAKADALRQEIDREAEEQRTALAGLFGPQAPRQASKRQT